MLVGSSPCKLETVNTSVNVRGKWLRSLLALVLGVAATMIGVSGSYAATNGNVSIGAGDAGKGAQYFTLHLSPGGSFTGYVIVGNVSPVPATLDIYSVNAATGTTSGIVYLNQNSPERTVANWVVPAVSSVYLQPNKSTKVYFTVKVPLNATPGDHLAGVVVQNAKPVTTTSHNFGVVTVDRGAVGVLIVVPGPAAFKLAITGAAIVPTSATGTASVQIDLNDVGNLYANPTLSVTLSGPNGYHQTVPVLPCIPAKEYCGQLGTILPDNPIPFDFPWPAALQPGQYTISITGSSQQYPSQVVHFVTRFDLKTALVQTIPNAPRPPVVSHLIIPAWLLLLVVVLVFLLLLTAYFLGYELPRRRRKRETGIENDPKKRAAAKERLSRL